MFLQYLFDPLYGLSHVVEYNIAFKCNGFAAGCDLLIRTNQGVRDVSVDYHLRRLLEIGLELIWLVDAVFAVGREPVHEELKQRVEDMRHEKYLHLVDCSLHYFIPIWLSDEMEGDLFLLGFQAPVE